MLPYIDQEATGRNIRAVREANSLTRRQVQEALGFSTDQAIYRWEKGKAVPSLDNLFALGQLFQMRHPDELIVLGRKFEEDDKSSSFDFKNFFAKFNKFVIYCRVFELHK